MPKSPSGPHHRRTRLSNLRFSDYNGPMSENQQPRDDAAAIGKIMVIGFWLILMGLLTMAANRWLSNAQNPNRDLSSITTNGSYSVQLQGNRLGHYLAPGTINGNAVTFLLDTGATSISIPETVAQRLNLKRGHPRTVNTANGSITVYAANLERVAIGALERRRVNGHINPHMDGEEILLGMSFLRHFELTQRDNVLTISQP